MNQILPRLLKIFPKATRDRDSLGRNCLEGIGFRPPGDSGGGDSGGGGQPPNFPSGNSVSESNTSEAVLNVPEAGLNQLNSSASKGSEPPEADPAISRVKNLWSVLTEEERTQFLQELGLEKNSGVNSSSHLQQVQNQDIASDTVSSAVVHPPSVQVQNPPEPPTTVQALANQLLLCQTWVTVAEAVNQDGDKLKKAALAGMTKEQRQGLTTLLAAHLCSNPSDLSKLQWVPVKLRDRALERLTFTIRRIGGGENVLDACLEYVSGCKFVSVNHLGLRYEQWIFSTREGQNLPVFGIDAIEAISLSDGSD